MLNPPRPPQFARCAIEGADGAKPVGPRIEASAQPAIGATSDAPRVQCSSSEMISRARAMIWCCMGFDMPSERGRLGRVPRDQRPPEGGRPPDAVPAMCLDAPPFEAPTEGAFSDP